MLDAGRGLSDVPSDHLVALLRALHRGDLDTPLRAEQIALLKLQERQESLMGALRGLDSRAIQAVLVCVLAERRKQP